ncbi:MAG: DUF1638 domain-containing protein [Desulfomonilaceae bacterium]
MKKKRTLVACKIFEEEINYILQKERESLDVEMVWIDAGLHSDLALLEEKLTSAIDEVKVTAENTVCLLYGRGCLPGIDSLARQKGVSVLSANNCLAAFAGDRVKEFEQNHAMVMTPSWVRLWPESMKRLLGWTEVDFRTNLGRYERILVLDPGLVPLTDEEILEFFDLVQVPVEIESLSLDRFHRVLMQLME